MRKPIPADQHHATPYLAVDDAARALDFYARAFGAETTLRLDQPDGRVGHAELTIGRAQIMLADEFPELGHLGPKTLGGTTVGVAIYVEDVDALAARAVAAGATLTRPIEDGGFGDRVAHLTDPFGHRWIFNTRVEDVSPDEMKRRVSAASAG